MSRLSKLLEKVGEKKIPTVVRKTPSSKQQEILEEVVRAIEIRRKLIDLSSFQTPKSSQE